MNVTIGKETVVYYTLPKALEAGETIRYTVMAGFNKISWTGLISSASESRIQVRLDKGPFRGFTATHEFETDGSLVCCRDNFTFQGFIEFSEEAFGKVMTSAGLAYAISSRKAAMAAYAAIEAKKQTQSFEALDQSATAG